MFDCVRVWSLSLPSAALCALSAVCSPSLPPVACAALYAPHGRVCRVAHKNVIFVVFVTLFHALCHASPQTVDTSGILTAFNLCGIMYKLSLNIDFLRDFAHAEEDI